MKILVTSDLHQWISKWKDLAMIVAQEKPRFILIAGDLLPKTGGYAGQKKFFSEMKIYLREMKRSVPATVLTYFGKPLPRIKVTSSEFNAMAWNSGALYTDLFNRQNKIAIAVSRFKRISKFSFYTFVLYFQILIFFTAKRMEKAKTDKTIVNIGLKPEPA